MLTINAGNSSFKGTFNQTDGTTVLRGVSFDAQHNISGGTFVLGAASYINSSASSWVLSGSGELRIDYGNTLSKSITGTGGKIIKNTTANLEITASGAGFSGKYAQSGGITILRAADFNGEHDISGGVFRFDTGSLMSGSAYYTLTNTGGLELNTANVNNINKRITGTTQTTITKNYSGSLIISTDSAGFGGTYTQSGSGLTTLTAASFAGMHNINIGSFEVSGSGASISAGAGFNLSGTSLNLTTNNNLSISGTISGSGSISKSGMGSLAISGSGAGFSGTYTQSGGTAKLTAASFTGAHNINSGTFEVGSGASISAGGRFVLSGGTALLLNTDNNLSVSGNITGNGSISKNGSGTLTISGSNSGFTGPYSQSAGTTLLNTTSFTGAHSISGGTFIFGNSSYMGATSWTLSGTGKLQIDLAGFNINRVITGSQQTSITKNNTGELLISASGANFSGKYAQSGGITRLRNADFNGPHEISGGEFIFEAGSSMSANSSYELSGNGNLILTNVNNINKTISGAGGTVTKNNTVALTISANGGGFSGTYTQSGGPTTLTAASFAGIHNINGGTFEVQGAASISAGAGFALAGALSLTPNNNLSINGNISGDGSISKSGSGTLTISGNNGAFTGAYSQSAGTTILNSAGFAGTHSISNGTFVFASGSSMNNSSSWTLSGNANLRIDLAGFDINRAITGSAQTSITKNNSGDMQISASGANFTGTYLQSGGNTTLKAASYNGAHNISGGSFIFGTNSSMSGSSAWTLSGSANLRIDLAGFNINRVITGSAQTSITKNAVGTLSISASGANFSGTYSQNLAGATTLTAAGFSGLHKISAGEFIFGTNSSMGANSSYELSGSGNLKIDIANFNINRPITGTEGTITKNNAGSLSISASGADFSGIYDQNTAGVTTLSAADFSGVHNISAGDFVFASGSSMGGSYALSGSGNLRIDLGGFDINKTISGAGGTVTKNNTVALTISANGGGFSGTYTQSGGPTTLTAASFAGMHNINGGSFEVQGSAASISADAGFSLAANTSLNLTTGNDLSINGNISGSGSISKSGAGSLTISGNNGSFSGEYSQSAGATTLNSASFAGSHSISGGTFIFGSGSSMNGSSGWTLSNSADLKIDLAGFNISRAITGGTGTSITKNNSGTLEINTSGTNFSGTYLQSAGATTLKAADFNGMHEISGGEFIFGTGSSMNTNSSYELSGNGNLKIDLAGFNINKAITGSLETKIIKNSAGTLSISASGANFSGTYKQDVAGAATLTAADFNGMHEISGGEFIFGTGSLMSANSSYGLSGSGNLKINIGNFDINRPISGTEGTITKNNAGSLSISVSGAGFSGLYEQNMSGETTLLAADFAGLHNIGAGDFIFASGSSMGGSYELSGSGHIRIDLGGFNINKTISGNAGTVTKNNTGSLTISESGAGFKGRYIQNSVGEATLLAASFGGEHEISAGIFSFGSGASVTNGSTYIMSKATEVNVKPLADVTFAQDRQISGGGVINNAGIMRIHGGQDSFTGTFNQTGGLTVLRSVGFRGEHNISNGTFSIEDGAFLQKVAYNITDLGIFDVNMSQSFKLSGQLTGDGTISQSGSGVLIMDGNNLDFTGDFRQYAGTTEIVRETLSGGHYITGGRFIFKDGSLMNMAAFYEVKGAGILRIENESLDWTLNGQISGDGSIEKTGSKTLFLNEGETINFTGALKIEEGMLRVSNQSGVNFSGLDVGQGGIYSSDDGIINAAMNVGKANISGTVKLDADLDNLTADIISAAGNIEINSSAKLNINMFGIVRSTDTRVTLFSAGGVLSGNFGGDPIEISGYEREIGTQNYVLQTSTDNKNLYLLRIGGSNLATHNGLSGLTHNQKEVAQSLDKISAGFTPGAMLSVEMEELIFNKIVGLNDTEKIRQCLTELSGSLIANALVMGATGRADEEIFGKVKWDGAYKSAWAHMNFYGANYAKDDNAGQTNFGGYGVTGGGNIACGDKWVSGLYGGVNFSSMEQDGGQADMSEFGAGLYGGYFGERVDFKGRIYAGILNYEISRRLEILGLNANSEVGGYNVKFDVRAERVGEFNELYGYSMFAQLKNGYTGNSGTSERGGGASNLEIQEGSYFRMELLAGAELNFNNGKLLWRAKAFGGYLAAGDKPVFNGEFISSGQEMEIWGSERGELGGGISWGVEYKINEKINAYLNITFDAAKNYSGYYGQLGVGYKFGVEDWGADNTYESEEETSPEPMVASVFDNGINEIIKNSGADEEWDISTKDDKVSINRETSGKLRKNENSSLWLVNYGGKVYVYKTSKKAREFFNKLKDAFAEVTEDSFKKIKGVELAN
jgi:autotransporter-associated beta strand protein